MLHTVLRLVVLVISLSYFLPAAAVDPSPCDIYFSGISLGEYTDGKQSQAYGKLGLVCDGLTHYVCISLDPGISAPSSTDNQLCVPRTSESDCSSAKAILYHIYQPDAAKKITSLSWGINKNIGTAGSMFCVDATACTANQPCEYPVMATTDSAQGSKNSGSYSYAASAVPRFFLYYTDAQYSTFTGSTVQHPVAVNAYVEAGCAVTANPFHFGSVSATSINQCIARDDIIKVNCNTGTSYSITLRPNNPSKYMGICGGTSDKCMVNLATVLPYPYLIYNLYSDSNCSTVWPSSSTPSLAGSSSWQSYPVYGKIISTSTAPAATTGYYEDVIDVVVGLPNNI